MGTMTFDSTDSTRTRETSPPPTDGEATPAALIIDDAPMVGRLLAAMLRRLGWGCEQLTDPAKAFATLERRRFDLILADHGMPGLTGSELAERLHRQGDAPPLVLVTGRELSETDVNRPGVLAVIHKPFALSDLERVIAKAAQRRG